MSYNKTNNTNKFDAKEKIKQLKDAVKNATLESMEIFSKSWVAGYINGLHKYSLYNYALANFQLMQKGKRVTAIAPFKVWGEKGRKVKAGEKAIHVFAPIIKKDEIEKTNDKGEKITETENSLVGYRLVPVFDISQTDGDLSQLDINKGGLVGDWTTGKSNIDFQTLVKIFNIPVDFYPISAIGENGFTDGKKISLLEKPENEMISTYIHELAHFNLHFSNEKIDSSTMEVEAESVSYLVCSAIGLENTKAPLYIKGWGDFSDKIRVNKIFSVVEKILKTIIDNSETVIV